MTETDLFQEPNDATPLDPALRGDLIQTWVTTRADLNEAEEENILKGGVWGGRRRGGAEALLDEGFSKNLVWGLSVSSKRVAVLLSHFVTSPDCICGMDSSLARLR